MDIIRSVEAKYAFLPTMGINPPINDNLFKLEELRLKIDPINKADTQSPIHRRVPCVCLTATL
ncbi:hypothetical protein [Parasphingorhabdus sp.]|uniref:hypothetical protein n=1 Tax=Parasphingorhabdus sp. TaxID=2709688 RepID=UPI003593C108